MRDDELDRIKTKADYNQFMHEIEICIIILNTALIFQRNIKIENSYFPLKNQIDRGNISNVTYLIRKI